jgi:hypothetical protein
VTAVDGLGAAVIAARYPRAHPHEYRRPVPFVVDALAISGPRRPVLVANLNTRVGMSGWLAPGQADVGARRLADSAHPSAAIAAMAACGR